MNRIKATRSAARRMALLTLAAAGGLTISLGAGPRSLAQAWGGSERPGASAPGDGAGPMAPGHGDQQFIVMMIPHHDGAIAMAELALSRARRPEIKALAASIKASQTRENAQMRAWYQQWYGKAVPAWPPATGWGWGWHGGSRGPMGMGAGMGMGMQGGTNLSALSAAADFDRAFLEQMIPHHQMGVMMASMAQSNSQHSQLLFLQQAMVRVQSDEIRQMEQWYRSWFPDRR